MTASALLVRGYRSLSYYCRTPLACTAAAALSKRFVSSYKVAIVGSGPSGCYTAKYLRQALGGKEQKAKNGGAVSDLDDEQHHQRIDILERLPTPYGLVRYGVAPDHPEVKNVQNDFDALFDDNHSDSSSSSNNKSRIRFLGNVQVGRDVSVDELRQMYDAVVLAYGCESDRRLGLPGEQDDGQATPGLSDCILSARQFVAWYNGHPDYVHIGKQVARALGVSSNAGGDDDDDDDDDDNYTITAVRRASVVVIGQGNVALDCARILAKGGYHLRDTDLASHCMPILGDGVNDVTIVGRRGHVQGAFTIKELRELTKLHEEGYGVAFHVWRHELVLGMNDASQQELDGPGGRPRQRIHKLLQDVAETGSQQEPDPVIYNCLKHLNLRFLLNPVRFEASEDDPTKLEGVVFERSSLTGEPGQQKVKGTGQFETIPAELAIVSIGYKSVALAGIESFFDERKGVIRHEHGRVDPASEGSGGLYASGWLKRGASGIIGTNIADAKNTVSTIVKDFEELRPISSYKGSDNDKLDALLHERGIQVVRWEGYQKLDLEEKTTKRSDNQPREKIVDIDLQLKAAGVNAKS